MRDSWPRLTSPLASCLAEIAATAPAGAALAAALPTTTTTTASGTTAPAAGATATGASAPPAGRRCALAVSGGPDSVALAALAVPLAREAGLRPELWHVHHGLLPMADTWTRQVERLAAALDAEVCVRRVAVPAAARARLGLEGAARAARREAFATLAAEQGCGHLLLAQHLDDQAETVLLRLLRGAGPDGMAAMRPRAAWAGAGAGLVAWRPWLGVARRDILPAARALAAALGVELADDPSNRDPDLARGWLREAVAPALARHWPGYRRTLARHAELAREMADWAEHQSAADLAPLQGADGALELAGWRQLQPESRRRLVLRRWLAGQGCAMPTAARLGEFERQLLTAAADRSPRWRHDGQVFGVYRGRCIRLPAEGGTRVAGATAVAAAAAMPPARAGQDDQAAPAASGCPATPRAAPSATDHHQTWQGEAVWDCPELGGRLHFDPAPRGLAPDWLAAEPLRLTLAGEGGRLRLAANRPSRTLKAWFQDAGRPPWERQRSPRLWRGGQLLWVAGLGCGSDLPQAEPGVALRWEVTLAPPVGQ